MHPRARVKKERRNELKLKRRMEGKFEARNNEEK